MQKDEVRPLKLSGDARIGYTYVVRGDRETGYRWQLVAPDGDTVCASDLFASRAACLETLRLTQRHAKSTHVIDEVEDNH